MRIDEYLEKMLRLFGSSSRTRTVDTVLDGDPGAELEKVAVCMMATQTVLERAAAEGCNLVITHEPLYWDHSGDTGAVTRDPVYLRKRAFVAARGLCVFHLHDHLHDADPDVISVGMMRALGWDAFRTNGSCSEFAFREKRLESLAEEMRRTLGADTIRYTGTPDLPVRNVVTKWGYAQRDACMALIRRHRECVLIVGETWEWEFVEYAADLSAFGEKKALIVVGHVPSEERGMEYCAELVASGIPGVPLVFLPTGNPFRQG